VIEQPIELFLGENSCLFKRENYKFSDTPDIGTSVMQSEEGKNEIGVSAVCCGHRNRNVAGYENQCCAHANSRQQSLDANRIAQSVTKRSFGKASSGKHDGIAFGDLKVTTAAIALTISVPASCAMASKLSG
jgi:hypothetical protein